MNQENQIETGDCGKRAFLAGLKWSGIEELDAELNHLDFKHTDDLEAGAKFYGLEFICGRTFTTDNNPVLVVYKADFEHVNSEYHAVFASDIAPFVRWKIHSVIRGWEKLKLPPAAGADEEKR